ncbi:MAG: hypothetical protein V3U11_12670 [Planctomycetota bacterium]
MLGSTLLGFSAILPGHEVGVGDTWKWKGDLLNIYQCDKLAAEFRLDAVQKKNDDDQVRISCKIDEGWHDVIPKVRAHLIYSPKLGLPLSSRYDYKSKTRETHLRTEARWIGRSGKTTVQAAQLEKKKGE